jgi:signal transduction histidine kinase
MFHPDFWPFNPISLSEIITKDTLAVIESGCCERLGRSLTLLDYGPDTHDFHRIDSINPRQHFSAFCATFRDKNLVPGGNEACEACDADNAARGLRDFEEKGTVYRAFNCHMGLRDATHIVRLFDHPVAILFAGQYRSANGASRIQRNVDKLGTGNFKTIQPKDGVRETLKDLSEKQDIFPDDFRARLKREAVHIQQIAEDAFQRSKRTWEQEFLNTLRGVAMSDEKTNLVRIRRHVEDLLWVIQRFCRCDYAVFFGSVGEKDTVLAPIASTGIGGDIKAHLPHFNWKKAGLHHADNPKMMPGPPLWNIEDSQEMARRGIRGDNSEFFGHVACVLPSRRGDRYRSALVLGPFEDEVDLGRERDFLTAVGEIVSAYFFSQLELRSLELGRKEWEDKAQLITHQLRTTLTPITTQIGLAQIKVRQLGDGVQVKYVERMLQRIEDLLLRLARGTRQTIEGFIMHLQPEDLIFEAFPLSALVVNCANSFATHAQAKGMQLVVDRSVEALPEAEVDVARLMIALSNLIDNATKYSYANTKIYVRARLESLDYPELASAVIEVDNLGHEIPPDKREYIFEKSTRGLTQAKMGKIPGSGLGLWEARAVVNAHGGEIGVYAKETSIIRPEGVAFQVVFSVKIPLRQKATSKGKG